MKTDVYFTFLRQAEKRWNSSSILLIDQISEVRKIERAAKGQWKETLNSHIDFLVDFNNAADDFIRQSMHLHRHEIFQRANLEEAIVKHAVTDFSIFQTLEYKLRSNASDK